MATIQLTGIREGRKIMVIKAVRAITGIGLKEAKAVADDLGSFEVSDVNLDAAVRTLDEHYAIYHVIKTKPPLLSQVVVFLNNYDPDVTVGHLRLILAQTQAALDATRSDA